MEYQHQYLGGEPARLPVGKVVCVGRNYAAHARELGNPVPSDPVLFIKPASSIVGVEEGFSIPRGQGSVHYEAEIALLIGEKLTAGMDEETIVSAVVGLAPALDLTLRDVQDRLKTRGLPWELAKAFDGACVLPPFVPLQQKPDYTDLDIRLTLNGEVRQDGNSRDMLYGVVSLLSHIVGHFSLWPGDVVLTGTPEGVGPLSSGDSLVLELVGMSRFETRVL